MNVFVANPKLQHIFMDVTLKKIANLTTLCLKNATLAMTNESRKFKFAHAKHPNFTSLKTNIFFLNTSLLHHFCDLFARPAPPPKMLQ